MSGLRCKCKLSGVTVMERYVTGLLTVGCIADEGFSAQVSSGKDKLVQCVNHKPMFEPQVFYKMS